MDGQVEQVAMGVVVLGPGVLVDVVEINRDIVEAAARHFGYNGDPSSKLGTTHIEDALAFLQRWVRLLVLKL